MITVNRSVITLSKSVITINKLVMTVLGSVLKLDVENKFPQAEFHHLQLRVLGVHDLQCGIKRMFLN